VSRRRLPTAAAVAAALAALAAPAAAQDVSEEALRGSIDDLRTEESIDSIKLRGSVESLEDSDTVGNRVELTVAADVLFEFDRARLTPQARETVARVARRIRDERGPVQVDGHTDSVGSSAYNLGLSRRRAAAVAAALRPDLPARFTIRAQGYGESQPVAPNTQGGEDNPAGRARNRRVTISFGRR
jgi:OOP family OmpA-OmpF porin